MTITIETWQLVLAVYLLIGVFTIFKTGVNHERGWSLLFYGFIALALGPIMLLWAIIYYVIIGEWY